VATESGVKLKIVGMDHIVIKVQDVEGALAFYIGTLGMEPHRVEEWRSGDLPFPCARINASTLIDLKPWTEDEPVGDGRGRSGTVDEILTTTAWYWSQRTWMRYPTTSVIKALRS